MAFSFSRFFCVLPLLAATFASAVVHLEYATEAKIQAYPGPSVQGINGFVPKNTVGSRLRGGAIYGNAKRVSFDDIANSTDEYDSIDVYARYRFSYLPIFGSIDKFAKGDLFTMSVGFGIHHGIYASTSFGINTKYFELGCSSFQRFTYQNFDYVGYEDSDSTGLQQVSENIDKLVFQYGAGGYASLFLGPVTLAYNGNVYRPQKTVVIDKENVDFPFKAPILFTNNFSISYWYSPTMEIQVGTTNLLTDFNGGNWSFFAGISLWSF